MNERDRSALIDAFGAALRQLDRETTFEAREEAIDVILMTLAALQTEPSDPETADRVRAAWRVLLGGSPEKDTPVRVHMLARDLRHVDGLLTWGGSGEESRAEALAFLRRALVRVDARLVASEEPVRRAVDDIVAKRSLSGVIADLLRSTGALDTNTREDRSYTQGRIDALLRRRS